MCCFTGTVDEVASTRIFAGAQPNGRQWLAYEMTLAADAPVAMVLPIPVPVGSADDAVRFVSFEHLPYFFDSLDTVFPVDLEITGEFDSMGAEPLDSPLEVVKVGAFVASFVPNRRDFVRLDPQFRLPDSFFVALPQFADFGFAVFQLDPSEVGRHGVLQTLGLRRPSAMPKRFHPMVFDFPRRDPGQLFFPTVHLHDGVVHPKAHFDHVLYAQSPKLEPGGAWRVERPNGTPFDELVPLAQGVVNVVDPIGKLEIFGDRPNQDVWISG
jgi:hypothetical protein